MFHEFVQSYRRGLDGCFGELSLEKLERVAGLLFEAQEKGRKIFVLGNGGSASTSSHMAVDLGKGTLLPGQPRLRVISLADNIGLITAWANDASYEVVFTEQLENLLEPGDVVIGVTASGNSPNVLHAMKFARERGAITVGFIGFGGGKLKEMVDIDITVSSRNYGIVEDFHLSLNHILSQYLKQTATARFASKSPATDKGGSLSYFFSKPPDSGTRPAIFFDRDGVINERVVSGYVTDGQQFRFIDGISESIAQLSELNLPIIVISNQACVGKGLLKTSSLQEITDQFVGALKAAGARVDAVYYCPHRIEDNCDCRKPRTGLLLKAAQDWKLDLSRSIFVGDSDSDVLAARSLKCRAILLQQDNGIAKVGTLAAPDAILISRTSEIVESVNHLLSTPSEIHGARV